MLILGLGILRSRQAVRAPSSMLWRIDAASALSTSDVSVIVPAAASGPSAAESQPDVSQSEPLLVDAARAPIPFGPPRPLQPAAIALEVREVPEWLSLPARSMITAAEIRALVLPQSREFARSERPLRAMPDRVAPLVNLLVRDGDRPAMASRASALPVSRGLGLVPASRAMPVRVTALSRPHRAPSLRTHRAPSLPRTYRVPTAKIDALARGAALPLVLALITLGLILFDYKPTPARQARTPVRTTVVPAALAEPLLVEAVVVALSGNSDEGAQQLVTTAATWRKEMVDLDRRSAAIAARGTLTAGEEPLQVFTDMSVLTSDYRDSYQRASAQLREIDRAKLAWPLTLAALLETYDHLTSLYARASDTAGNRNAAQLTALLAEVESYKTQRAVQTTNLLCVELPRPNPSCR